jgi:hypothetical protein
MRLVLVVMTIACAAGAAPELPGSVKHELDRLYPGWSPVRIAPQVAAWFADYRLPYAPDRIAADFDGDGRTDYAVRVQSAGRAVTIAFLDRDGKFQAHVLSTDAPDSFTYLLLYRRGDKDFDFTKLKPFRHAHDAIGLMYFDKTPLTFRYVAGKFQKMLSPSDEELEQ